MRMNPLITSFLMLAAASSPQAQEHHGRAATGAARPQSPYASMQHRAIKALSDEEIADLRAGRGMGLALVAELNGYPGPSHALELADRLELSADQRSHTASALARMKDEPANIGSDVISGEMQLEAMFAGRSVTAETLDMAVMKIAKARSRLRAAHLRYHLQMVAILTPEQVTSYARLRGYTTGGPDPAARR